MVSTHIYGGFQEDRWENIHFYSKPRHVTPQIDCLGKSSPVLRFSTHICWVSKEFDVKTFIFRVNLGLTYCCEPKIAISINFVKEIWMPI